MRKINLLVASLLTGVSFNAFSKDIVCWVKDVNSNDVATVANTPSTTKGGTVLSFGVKDGKKIQTGSTSFIGGEKIYQSFDDVKVELYVKPTYSIFENGKIKTNAFSISLARVLVNGPSSVASRAASLGAFETPPSGQGSNSNGYQLPFSYSHMKTLNFGLEDDQTFSTTVAEYNVFCKLQ